MPTMLGRFKSRMRRSSSTGADTSDSSHKQPTTSETIQRKLGLKASNPQRSDCIDYTKVEELAAFDACVEACDALAASSSYAHSSGKTDPETGLQDCSVLVSPDGNLLIIPQEYREEIYDSGEEAEKSSESDKTDKDKASPFKERKSPHCTQSSMGLHFADSDEYASSVAMGNDLKPDKTINGFSAMGWSPSATSLALRQTSESLREMTAFVEMLILSRKEIAARESHACAVLRSTAGISSRQTVPPMPLPEYLRHSPVRSKGRWRSNGSNDGSNGLSDYDKITELEASPPLVPNEYNRESTTLLLSSGRVGPLNFPGGTLHAATVAMENYHSTMAENDSNRWRRASMSRGSEVGVLPALRKAYDQAAERAYRREKALREMQSRAAAMEKLLAQRKAEAMACWDAVHRAEEEVTRIVEQRMMERRRERERRRMEKFQEEEDKRIAENTDLGATPGEIWDMVSAVAESLEDGSFAPTGLPDAPVAGPKDVSQDNEKANEESSEPDTQPSSRPSTPPIPLASRAEIEYDCKLPELRAAALAADEAIEDAAGSLLNILSTLDTTRRSARVAAETCLLSAGHAQAACIRSLIALERESIEDRLQNIGELERIAESIEVRADLDAYITADKKEIGGSTWLGDDDDGGVASALAILSSHVEGSMGLQSTSKVSTDGWGGAQDEGTTPEQLDDAVEDLFKKNDLLLDTTKDCEEARKAREDYEATVDFLCVVAEDPSARSRRSTICYALNSKRGSDAEIASKIQFNGLCRVFQAILSGCDREAGGVAMAKMCMMLAQTFYMVEQEDKDAAAASGHSARSSVARSKRIFIKHRITGHSLWMDEEFWCVILCCLILVILLHL